MFLGGKVTQSTAEGVVIIDSLGMKISAREPAECQNLPGSIELLWTHAQEARGQCVLLESTLARLPGSCNFPIIVGRRPVTQLMGKENHTHAIMVSFKFFDL